MITTQMNPMISKPENRKSSEILTQGPYLLSSGGRSSKSAGEEEPWESRIGGSRGDRAVPKYSLESLGNSLGRISTPRGGEGEGLDGMWDRDGWEGCEVRRDKKMSMR
jgi:hypothetical protein